MGKTTLCKLISDAYGLLYISPEKVTEDLAEELVSNKVFFKYQVFRHYTIISFSLVSVLAGKGTKIDLFVTLIRCNH